MAIAAERDAGLGPVLANAPDEAAQMRAHLDAGRRLAGSQNDRDGTAAFGVVDMNRQEAALVVVRIEQRQLLMAVHDVAGIVDIQNDRRRLTFVGRYPLFDQCICEADGVLQRRRVLQSRQRRLRTQVSAAVGQPPAGELERGIGTQKIQIVGVLVAAGNGEHASADHVGERMRDPRGIAAIGKRAGKPLGDPQAALSHRQQHDTTVRSEAAAVEISCDFLAHDGWKRERRNRSVGHGECGWRAMRVGLASTTESYAVSALYATLANLEMHAP